MTVPGAGPDDTSPTPEAAHLGDFEIGELLGQGSSATVHRAVHTTLQAPVALKCWRRSPSEDDRRKFLGECRLQWQLSSEPTIVRLFWAGAAPGERPWLAMELYEQSLADRLLDNEPISTADALRWAQDLLHGLSAIHDAEHLHRDVKPGNLLLKGGHAALADLGIAMGSTAWTSDNAAGTARYLAPEIVRGAAPDYRSDVYSAALTIEHMFGGRIPGWLDPLLVRATSYNPADRPACATEFLRALTAAASTSAGTVPLVEQPVGTSDETVAAPRRASRRSKTGHPHRKAITVALVLVAVAAVAVSIAAIERRAARTARSQPPATTIITPSARTVSLHDCAPLSLTAQPGGHALYVACQDPGRTLRHVEVIDQRTGADRAWPVTALALIASPDGRRLYAATDNHTLEVLDAATGAVQQSIRIDAIPDRMAISPNGRDLYITNSQHGHSSGYARYVVDVDTATGTVHYIATGASPADAAFTDDGRYVLVTNRYSNTVAVIASANRTVIRTITVGHQPERLAILTLPGADYAYVTNSADNTVSVIDVAAGTELFTTAAVADPSAVAVDQTPAGYTYIADAVHSDVAVIEKGIQPHPRTVLALPAGHDPQDLLVSPDGHLDVANVIDATITILPVYRS